MKIGVLRELESHLCYFAVGRVHQIVIFLSQVARVAVKPLRVESHANANELTVVLLHQPSDASVVETISVPKPVAVIREAHDRRDENVGKNFFGVVFGFLDVEKG